MMAGEVNSDEDVPDECHSTHCLDMTADHEADVLGERMNQLKQSRTSVWITSQHQTLGPGNTHFTHSLKLFKRDFRPHGSFMGLSGAGFRTWFVIYCNCTVKILLWSHLDPKTSRLNQQADLKFFTWSSTPVRLRQ